MRRVFPLMPVAALGAAVVLAAGCGPDLDYKQGRHLERTGQHFRAVEEYRSFLSKHPDDPRAVEVSWRAGRIYAESLGRCEEAVPLLEAAARSKAPEDKEMAEQARLGLLSCPDFFPLRQDTEWTYVDTLSGGKNMHLRIGVYAATANVRGLILGEMYAGEQMILKYKRSYRKEGWSVYETIDGVSAPILKYPLNAGRSWEVIRDGKRERFSVEAAGIAVQVKAGRYDGCLKIKRRTLDYPSWIFDYYCPGIGRVKTSIGVATGENPNTELAKYKTRT
ncbi:MAG: tetratricopeptide repeat protein [Elusimicrobiota bacterium]